MINASLSATNVAKTTPGQLINQLIEEAFAPSLKRLERSVEYVNGARALLLQQLIGKPLACLYLPGTAAADAFFAGVEEGRSIHVRYLSSQQSENSATALSGLKGHAYIAARNLNKPIQRVQTSVCLVENMGAK
ncbi:hypothetical protein [Duganella sp. Root336D2]|uniref:hypothetical protein n=1 Tax=Duganella sp. Root336D2 TaxID=1736518 RepID=UPI0006F76A8C|nr:hypothetical protein [Duganella sp. Root336D2]KQV51339.1 hypothetical protein ASD07_10620 [Duganella sp. Root336D2]